MPKNSSKSKARDIRALAALVEVKPLPSSMQVEQGAIEAMKAAFQQSDVFTALSQAAQLHDEAEELRAQARALAREQDAVKITKETLARDLRNAEVDGGRVQASKEVLRAAAKNAFLTNPDIAKWRAKIVKNFNSFVAEIVAKGLEADSQYQALVAEGALITKNAERLTSKLAKAEKKFNSLEKKINQLIADASRLDADAMVLEGGSHD